MIRFVLADLRRQWIGSAVVVLLVALATALGVAVTLQERALRLGSARAADRFDLVIGAPGSETQLLLSSIFLQSSPLSLLPGSVFARLSQDSRVVWAAPIGFGDSFFGRPIVGTTTPLVIELSPFAEGRVFETLGEAVAGASVDLPLGYEIKPTHGLAGLGGHTHTELAYRVVGRLAPTGTAWDRAILVPIRSVWTIHGMDGEAGRRDDGAFHDHGEGNRPLDEHWNAETPGVPAILLKPRSIADAYRLRQDYRTGETLAVFPGEVLTNLYGTLGDAKRILAAVASSAQVLVAAALVLVMVVHISQRRRQIGALRAFGAPRFAVFAIIWTELFALAAVGIGLGFVLGAGVAWSISRRFSNGSGVVLPIEFASGDVILASAFIGFSALLAVVPALLAYRQSPAAALRA